MQDKKTGNGSLMTGKSERTFEIFFRLLHGEDVSLGSLADEYGVSKKSISRDINSIKSFLSNHRELLHNAELSYSNKNKAYCLSSDEFLENKELFAIVKAIIGCRCFSREELTMLITKLKRFTTIGDRKKFDSFIKKDVFHYNEIKMDCDSIIENLWRIIDAIDEKDILTIDYFKMNREEVKRRIKPVSVMFSEYYFYLIAYIADDEDYTPKFFRIDRIVSITVNREKFSLEGKYVFDEGDLREKNQLMFPGKTERIRFEFSGLSVQAILDKIPKAKIIREESGVYTIEAEVNTGHGLVMYLLSQGSWVKVLSPPFLVEEMKKEIEKMAGFYG